MTAAAYDIPFACAQLFVPLCEENVSGSDFAAWVSSPKNTERASMLELVDSLDVDVDDFVNVGATLIDVSEACQEMVKRMSEKLGIKSVRVAVSSADLKGEIQEDVVFKCFPFEQSESGEEPLPKEYTCQGVVCLENSGRVVYAGAEKRDSEAKTVLEMHVKGNFRATSRPSRDKETVLCYEWDETVKKLVSHEYKTREELLLRKAMPFDYDPKNCPYPKYPTAYPGNSVLLVKSEPSDPSSRCCGVTFLLWIQRENDELQPISVPLHLLLTKGGQYKTLKKFIDKVLEYIKQNMPGSADLQRHISEHGKSYSFEIKGSAKESCAWVGTEPDSSVVLVISRQSDS